MRASSKQEMLRDLILDNSKYGNVVFNAVDGLRFVKLDEFVQQPAEGILYDLNRSKEIALTFIKDEKWINDFAVALVIEKLKEMLDSRQNE